MRKYAVLASAVLVSLMIVAQLIICAAMTDSVGDACSGLDAHLKAALESSEVNDPEWWRSYRRSREVMHILKAVHNRSAQLLRVQLLLGAGAIGFLVISWRGCRPREQPDNPRVQQDTAGRTDGRDDGQ